MTLAKYTIRKESGKIEVDVEKIRRFTTIELAKLASGPLPFCYQLGADVLMVGNSKITKTGEKCWNVMHISDDTGDFFLRKAAIFYCIALHKKNFTLAREIHADDTLLNDLEFDAILYRYRYNVALKRDDVFNIGLFSDRYSETMMRINQTKSRLRSNFAK